MRSLTGQASTSTSKTNQKTSLLDKELFSFMKTLVIFHINKPSHLHLKTMISLSLVVILLFGETSVGAFVTKHTRESLSLRKIVSFSPSYFKFRPLNVSSPSSNRKLTNGKDEGSQKPAVLLQTVVKDVPINSLMHFVKNTYKPPSQLPLPFSIEFPATMSDSTVQWVCDFVQPSHVLSIEIVAIQKKKKDPSSTVMNMAMVAVKRSSGLAADSLVLASEKQLLRDFEKKLDQLHLSLPSIVDAEVERTELNTLPTESSFIENKTSRRIKDKPTSEAKISADGVIDADIIPKNNKVEPIIEKKTNSRKLAAPPDLLRSKFAGKQSEEVFEDFSSKGLNIVFGDDSETRNEINLNDFWNKDVDQLTNEERQNLEETFVNPEDFAKEVLDFASKESDKEKEGASFAEGVFQAAREVVQESISIKSEQVIGVEDGPSEEEEELRRLFEAGRNIVENKMTVMGSADESVKMKSSTLYNTQSKEKQIEKDLAELEVRILRNSWDNPIDPSERLDLFAPPPSFDETIFDSTSVNYPGALPGTRENVKIHEDLKQAIDYAQFAVKVLSSLDEEIDLESNEVRYFRKGIEMPLNDVLNLQKTVNEAVKIGIIDSPQEVMAEKSRLKMLVEELSRYSIDRFSEIVEEYKDLLLSDRFVNLVKERFAKIIDYDMKCKRGELPISEEMNDKHDKEREILGLLVKQAMLLLKEVQALGAELEVMQLEIIRSICQVAMDPQHRTEEEAAIALTDAVRDMLPLLDETFVAYLKYAVAEEEARLARRGILEDPDQNRWLCILKIVQQGVYAEIGRKVARHVEIIWYCMRMKTRQQRRELLRMNVDNMATMDIRPFRKVVDNIVGALGRAAKGEFDEGEALGGWTKRILQLAEDIEIVLPPERMDVLSRDADKWLEKQKERILEQRRKTAELIQARKKGKEVMDRYLASGAGEEDRMP